MGRWLTPPLLYLNSGSLRLLPGLTLIGEAKLTLCSNWTARLPFTFRLIQLYIPSIRTTSRFQRTNLCQLFDFYFILQYQCFCG